MITISMAIMTSVRARIKPLGNSVYTSKGAESFMIEQLLDALVEDSVCCLLLMACVLMATAHDADSCIRPLQRFGNRSQQELRREIDQGGMW